MFTNTEMITLSDAYSKQNLEKCLLPNVIKFYYNYSLKNHHQFINDTLQKLVSKKPVAKSDIVEICFSIFKEEEIFTKFLETLPKPIQILTEILLWKEKLDENEIMELTGEKITIPSPNSYESAALKDEYYFFTVAPRFTYYSGYSNPYVLSLHPILKNILKGYYPKPAHYEIIALDKIPAIKNKFSAEEKILQELPRLLSMHLKNVIKYAARGRPTDAAVKKLQKNGLIEEIFTTQIESLVNIRSRLLAGIINGLRINNIDIDGLKLLRDHFFNQYIIGYPVCFILTHVKGWSFLNEDEYDDGSLKNFYMLFKLFPKDKWMSVQNLIDYINYREIKIAPVKQTAFQRLYIENDVKSKYGYYDKTLVSSKTNLLFMEPYIKGTIFLLASLGMVEIAFDNINVKEHNKTYYSVYDGLKYFKLTRLGEYILGLSPDYTPSFIQQKNKLILSEDSLMIIAEGDINVLDVLIANYTEKAGSNRYKVTPAQFLKDCKNLKQIEEKMMLFKKIIAAPLPPYWVNQFTNWKLNSLKITKSITTVVFAIPSTEKELHKLLAQDSILKGMILKAENFNILVNESNLTKFKNRMKDFGYLIE